MVFGFILAIALSLAMNTGHAGVITTVDGARANANDSLRFNGDFAIDTGTAMTPVTSFMFDGKNYMGRIVTPINGTPIVVYDLTTLAVDAGKTVTVLGRVFRSASPPSTSQTWSSTS